MIKKTLELTPVFLRTAHNYDRNAAGDESGLSCPEPTLTQQSFAEECDINTIMRKFGVTGELPQNLDMPTYGDFESITDFQTAMNTIVRAEEAFGALPAEVRYRFANDPQRFMEFVADEKNFDEAVRLGVALPRAEVVLEQVPPAKPASEAVKPALQGEKPA